MPDVTALRFLVRDQEANEFEERDALVSVEIGDVDTERPIDLHLSPRTAEVETCSLSATEAWALARELARAAAETEHGV